MKHRMLTFLFCCLIPTQAALALSTLYVDFGPADGVNGNATTGPDANGHWWNSLTDPSSGAAAITLVNSSNGSTPFSLSVTTALSSNGILNGGLLAPAADRLGDLAIATATQDFFHTASAGAVTLKGLDQSKSYVFFFFASRNDPETRVTAYTLLGANHYRGTLQTSGANLGGDGYNGNTGTILRSDTITPNSAGEIRITIERLEGAFAYLNTLRIDEVNGIVLRRDKEPLHIAFMGSSVPSGTGATTGNGYVSQFSRLLQDRFLGDRGEEWYVTNISVPGNKTTDVLGRWQNDLLPLCSRYVVYALSLANEGIIGGGQAIFDQFKNNMQRLIADARNEGIEPLVTNCYPNANYTATEYAFIRQMDLLIAQWDVASVNLLGALDNGAGVWAEGYQSDALHPNDSGHAEFCYALVPSLFDALHTGKTQPSPVTGTALSIDPATGYTLACVPEEVLHPFTLSFEVQTAGSGRITDIETRDGTATVSIDKTTGRLTYHSPASAGIEGGSTLDDEQWHRVTLTHYYARGTTFLYLDSVLQGSVTEKLVAQRFTLGDTASPDARYRQFFLYRSGMTGDEIAALTRGELLKSSLEIYSPLDAEGLLSDDTLVNLAQSTNRIVASVNLAVGTLFLRDVFRDRFEVFSRIAATAMVPIRLSLARSDNIIIRVFSLDGRVITTIAETPLDAGEYSFVWNTAGIAAGCYVVCATTPTRTFAQNIVIGR